MSLVEYIHTSSQPDVSVVCDVMLSGVCDSVLYMRSFEILRIFALEAAVLIHS